MVFAAQLRLLALCTVAISALALSIPPPHSRDGVDADALESKPKQVLILGGGVAGIIAARKLTEEGITDFVIVEARDELGGRMHSTSFGAPGRQLTVEIGANWIQGTQEGDGPANPILVLSRKHNLSAVESDYTTSMSKSLHQPVSVLVA